MNFTIIKYLIHIISRQKGKIMRIIVAIYDIRLMSTFITPVDGTISKRKMEIEKYKKKLYKRHKH